MENNYFDTNPTSSIPAVDFDDILKKLEPLSKGAKVHFVWKLVQTFTPGMCRTLIRYSHQKLKVLNNDLSDRRSTKK